MNREKEFVDALVALSEDGRREIKIRDVSYWINGTFNRGTNEHWEVLARQVLRTLGEIGYVERGAHNEIVLTDAFFNSAPARIARANRQEIDNQRRPPPQPPPSGDNGPNEPGDLGGAGFREVLSHPFLFAVSKEDFNEMLDAI